jgi:hypothetical protein
LKSGLKVYKNSDKRINILYLFAPTLSPRIRDAPARFPQCSHLVSPMLSPDCLYPLSIDGSAHP